MQLWPLLLLGCSVASLASHRSNLAVTTNVSDRIQARTSTRLSTAANFVAEESPSVPIGGDATLASSTFNLAKSIVGAGVLSLPNGVAFFADDPKAILPASILCTVFGVLAAYSFHLIGKVCADKNATSFQDVWAKTVNPKTAKFISISITALCFMASLTYSIVIGDSFSSLFKTFGLPSMLTDRTNVILLISTLVLLPLCSLNSLNALAPFSLLGLGGTMFTAVVMGIRYFDGSYQVGGKFFEEIVAKPLFKARGGISYNHMMFVLISMLSTSYIAHYNAPQFYTELKNPSMPRYNAVVTSGFVLSILFNVYMMSIGFLSFGGNSAGFILNNYAGSDVLATASRLAIGLALLTGYPFTFSALREGVLDLRKLSGDKRQKSKSSITLVALSITTLLALVLKDVGFVVSLSGALFGCFLIFIVPAILNITNTKDKLARSGKQLSGRSLLEVMVNYGMIGMGVLMTIIGVAVSTLKQLGKL